MQPPKLLLAERPGGLRAAALLGRAGPALDGTLKTLVEIRGHADRGANFRHCDDQSPRWRSEHGRLPDRRNDEGYQWPTFHFRYGIDRRHERLGRSRKSPTPMALRGDRWVPCPHDLRWSAPRAGLHLAAEASRPSFVAAARRE